VINDHVAPVSGEVEDKCRSDGNHRPCGKLRANSALGKSDLIRREISDIEYWLLTSRLFRLNRVCAGFNGREFSSQLPDFRVIQSLSTEVVFDLSSKSHQTSLQIKLRDHQPKNVSILVLTFFDFSVNSTGSNQAVLRS